ncbi:MAG: hypothetical protein QOF93_541, partial [Verrucomicrobiota bacterium]
GRQRNDRTASTTLQMAMGAIRGVLGETAGSGGRFV